MNARRTFAALAVLLACGGPLRAGPPVVVFVGPRAGVGFGPFVSPYGGPFFAGPVYGGGFRVSSLTIIGPPPAAPPQIIININNNNNAAAPAPAAPAAAIRDEDFPDKIVVRPRPPAREVERVVARPEPPAPDPPLPGRPAGDFRPLLPGDRERVQPAAAPDAPKEDEYTRLMRLGVAAFAAGEYGRAERRFAQAAGAAPKEPLPQFYLAQAQFALGNYREAVAAVHAGLRLDPDWPAGRFRARELYAANAADFQTHFDRLEAARAAGPTDPVLLFLSAYQMWFDGRKEDARPPFRRAARLVAEPRFIDLFLLAQPGGAVAAR